MTHWAENLTHPSARAKARVNPLAVGYGLAAAASVGVWGVLALMAVKAF
ncbi:hypothetical protein [Brevundimonas sp. TSRC1-1]